MKISIQIERLRELLSYDGETGQVSRLVLLRGQGNLKTGCISSHGYITISVDGKQVYAHRIAWALFYGYWPQKQIDHINGNKTDNRIANLREADHSINAQNMKRARKDSKSGVLGVSAVNRGKTKKWNAHIAVNGKQKNLGNFSSIEEAERAYLSAKRQMHPGGTL